VKIVVGVLIAIGVGGTAVYETHKDAEKAKRDAPFKACTNGDGKACDGVGRFEQACLHDYFPGCMHAAEAAAKAGNYGTAVDDYDHACSGGYAPACAAVETYVASTKVGITTRLGHYEKQCDGGKLDACDSAGLLYANANGDGLARDEPRAASLYKKACGGGVSAGCDLLAQACRRGVNEACPDHTDGGKQAPSRSR
jgi:TPR repeat protein